MAEVSKMKPTLGGDFLAKHSQHPDTPESHTQNLWRPRLPTTLKYLASYRVC